jgi:MFS transporter, DHA1 family, inner membrane transport protein
LRPFDDGFDCCIKVIQYVRFLIGFKYFMGLKMEKMKDRRLSTKQFVIQVIVISFSRLIMNTARRFVYTYVPVLSRGLGVPITSITSLIAFNQGTSVLGVVFGPLGDRFGYKLMILVGLMCLTSGMLAVGIIPLYATLAIAMLLAGLGKSILDPAIQAYVGQRVPYEKRGLIMGLLEISWAGSTLVGIPVVGILIEKAGWQAPFLMIGVLTLICLIIIWFIFPKDRRDLTQSQKHNNPIFSQLNKLLRNRATLCAALFSMLIAIANDNIFVIYGVWMESTFNLSIVALGLSTTVIGVAELIGEGFTAFLSDRIGLKKAIFIGLIISGLSFGLLPFADKSLPLALSAIFVIFLSFEFTLVTSLGLISELAPESRGAMMSTFHAAAGIGRVFGASMGGYIWRNAGLMGISITSVFFTLIAIGVFVWGLHDWKK